MFVGVEWQQPKKNGKPKYNTKGKSINFQKSHKDIKESNLPVKFACPSAPREHYKIVLFVIIKVITSVFS